MKRGCNDTIYQRLDNVFTIDQAVQQWVAVRGGDVSREKVRWMLKNWRRQGLAMLLPDGTYRKTPDIVSDICSK